MTMNTVASILDFWESLYVMTSLAAILDFKKMHFKVMPMYFGNSGETFKRFSPGSKSGVQF